MRRVKSSISRAMKCHRTDSNPIATINKQPIPTKRKTLQRFAALALSLPISACGQHNPLGGLMQPNSIILNAVLWSYYDQIDGFNATTFDVFLNGVWVGGAGGGGSVITGVKLFFGPQKLTWRLGGPERMPRLGETVTAKNNLILKPVDIPKGSNYIGIHIYPDETAEFNFSTDNYPQETPRGKKLIDAIIKRRTSHAAK
ncbi:hypothetical protein [Sapientia aquatica]|uniref:DUF3304 domain-containing protein n=1 Tax=Sapientia aquatica TaxID=1549640 RepID=A0A4R5W0W8_9BURK|nr:hypothetical protein [Sapientia aquatica]TDK65212.1 hypothetical protein E2I14_12345 [Sapientia aquatica]